MGISVRFNPSFGAAAYKNEYRITVENEMQSAMVAFCESYGTSAMLDLLTVEEMTPMQALFTLDLLSELVRNDPGKASAVQDIRKAFHPVDKARAVYAQIQANAKAILKKQDEIAEMLLRPAKKARVDEEETQLLNDDECEHGQGWTESVAKPDSAQEVCPDSEEEKTDTDA